MAIKEYKCSNCNGAIKFDGKNQNMKCAHCDSEFEIVAFEEYQKEIETCSKGGFNGVIEDISVVWENPEADGMETGVCLSCGAELFGCSNVVATLCPCCGNAKISMKWLSGMLKPDYVIPFKLREKNAVAALRRFCKYKWLLPSDYLEEKRMSGMQGVYVPFWLFDAKVAGRVLFRGIDKINSGKNSAYSVIRAGSLDFEKIPVDGSEKMDDDYMDAIEPFYYGGMQSFNPTYLAGYLAEKYDISAQQSKERVEKRIKGSFEQKFRETVGGYKSVKTEGIAIDIKEARESYALFPVWVFNAKYDNINYQFMVNGQTGRLAGRLPVDNGKVHKYKALLTGAYGALFTTLTFVIMRPSVVKWLLGGDEFGSAAVIQNLVNPAGRLLDFIMNYKIFVILALWGIAYALAYRIVKKWKVQMNTVGLKTEACDYIVKDSLNLTMRKDSQLYTK